MARNCLEVMRSRSSSSLLFLSCFSSSSQRVFILEQPLKEKGMPAFVVDMGQEVPVTKILEFE